MAKRKSIDFLPQVFKTQSNKRFLNATVDQLIQEPALKKIYGYIGQQDISPVFQASDYYIAESDNWSQFYQLEPGVVLKKRDLNSNTYKISNVYSYPDLLNQITGDGGIINNHDRMFRNTYYNYNGFVDLDKLTNYRQYYWAPTGSLTVDVTASGTPLENEFFIHRTSYVANNQTEFQSASLGRTGYKIDGYDGEINPTLTLRRGGRYVFNIGQGGHKFWIQTEIGTSGVSETQANISTRDVLGVSNNGIDEGGIVFNVPFNDAQDKLINLPNIQDVDIVVHGVPYDAIQGATYSEFIKTFSFDGVRSFDNKLIAIIWPNDTSWGDVPVNQRGGLWRVKIENDIITLNYIDDWANGYKTFVKMGDQYGHLYVYKDSYGQIIKFPTITAPLDTLYYVDADNPLIYGTIKIVDADPTTSLLDVNDIIGRDYYTSPNGVQFTSGLKIKFTGSVTPVEYQDREFVIEGVGKSIVLVPWENLATPETINTLAGDLFDQSNIGYDMDLYDQSSNAPQQKDYITINRASVDGNGWSRNNRWFHRDVLQYAATVTNQTYNFDSNQQAKRPIVEFNPNYKLFNYGTNYAGSVDAIDTFTTHAFGTVEGQNAYAIKVSTHPEDMENYSSDGVLLQNGRTVVFINDTDPTVRKTIYRVESVRTRTEAATFTYETSQLATSGTSLINMAEVTALQVGYRVTGPNISDNTTITTIDYANKIVYLSNPVLANIPLGTALTFNNSAIEVNSRETASYNVTTYNFSYSGSNALYINDLSSLSVGQKVIADGIPANTSIIQIDKTNATVYLSNDITHDIQAFAIITFNNSLDQVHLIPIKQVNNGDNIIASNGINNQGLVYYYVDGVWKSAQQRNSRPQFPLFDIIDSKGFSFSNESLYVSNNFTGSQLFGYAIGSGVRDSELGFPLQYKTIGNIGDIVFQNYYATDTFTSNNSTTYVNTGYVPVIVGWDNYTFANGWTRVKDKSKQYISLVFTASTSNYNNFDLGVKYENSYYENNLFVYINNVLQPKSAYTLTTNTTTSILNFTSDLAVNDRLFVKIYGTSSNLQNSYTMPRNLTNNSNNTDFATITLGQIRNHVNEIGHNSLDLIGEPAGDNNFRDINYNNIGGKLVQHSASMRQAALLFSNPDVDPIRTINFASESYQTFKAQLLDLISNRQFNDSTNYRECVDIILNEFSQTANSTNTFYYTDMVAGGNNYTVNSYIIQDTTYRNFNTIQNYANQLSNYTSVLIYLNDALLTKDVDYTLNGLTISLSDNLAINRLDVLSVYEYPSTLGCNIPSTPSKLGVYPKFVPEIIVDDTYTTPQTVIVGHDGSRTVAWGDYRDNILLEFEKRVYNNITIEYKNNSDFDLGSVQPGAFRSTGYSLEEWTQLLSTSYLAWSGQNNVDIFTNDTTNDNEFTWNFSQGTDRLFGQNVPGYWRGIYNYFYDTDRPHTHPWEMLGFTIKPTWWENRYGPAPYSNQNNILWNDLELGYIYNGSPNKAYINELYARTGLSQIIPVDEHGNLVHPIIAVLGSYDANTASDNWRVGDSSAQENAWRRSSAYPFAIQMAWCLARPAEYCALKYNTRDVQYVESLDQILNVTTNGRKFDYSVTNESQYIPGINVWIRDLLTYNNLDVNYNWIDVANNSTFNLVYKMSGYSDKSYLTIVADQVSPQSTNVSILIPQENYQLKVTKSAPVARAVYSAVVVRKTVTGYQIDGFDKSRPYFLTIPSRVNGNNYAITVGNDTAIIYKDAENTVVSYPYGTVFNTEQQVADFLVSYGRYLENQGFAFNLTLVDNQTVADWTLAVKEFLFWNQQQWGDNTVISLTPAGTNLTFNNPYGVVDTITNDHNYTKVVDSDGQTLTGRDYRVYREDNSFSIELKNNQKGIHLLDIAIVQYEHTLIFDNSTVFNDIIYDEQVGSRQFRLRLDGAKTQFWNGSLYAPGFVINYSDIQNWNSYTDYFKGEIILYKKQYFAAQKFIPGTQKFNANDWFKINGDLLSKQLIPNMASGAAQFIDFYNPDTADLNTAADIQSKHAVGFQDRKYFTDLGLDRVSQYKFYLGMIAQKGSQAVINAFLRNKQTNIDSNITLSEQWAVKLGNYGGIQHVDRLEFNIGNSVSINNQYLFEFINNQDTRNEKYNSVKQSDLLIRPRNYTTQPFAAVENKKQLVATTGPVQSTDVAATVFDIAKIYNISNLNFALGESSKIWVAADGDNQWGVYRLTQTDAIFVTNVNQTAPTELTFTTNIPHGLQNLDYIMIKGAKIYANSRSTPTLDISGFYRVNTVSGTSFTVKITQDTVIASGPLNAVLLKLVNVRFDTVRDFGAFTPARGWQNSEIVYIDNGINGYDVKQNTNSWAYNETRSPVYGTPSDEFGSSISISNKQGLAVVGAPGKGNTGQVYVFESEQDSTWHEFTRFVPDSRDSGFGSAVQFNDNNIVAISSPHTDNRGSVYVASVASGDISLKQVIHYGNVSTFTSLSSSNSNIYVSPTTSLDSLRIGWSVTGSGITDGTVITNLITGTNYNIIQLNQSATLGLAEQITAIRPESAFGTSITTSKDGNWLFVGNSSDDIGRVYAYKWIETDTKSTISSGDGINKVFGFPSSVFNLGLTHRDVQVRVDDNLKIPDIDYIQTPNADSITFFVAPDVDSVVTVTYGNYFKEAYSFTTDDPEALAYGSSVSTSADGRHLVVGAKLSNATLDQTYINAGKAYIYERAVENFVADGNTNSFTTYTQFYNPSVTVDGVSVPATFYNGNNTVVLSDYPLVDSIVSVETNQFVITKITTADVGQKNSNFGESVKICPTDCSVYVGAPGWDYNSKENGAVFRFLNIPKLYGTATGTLTGFTMPAGYRLRINDFLVTFTGGGASQCVADINAAKIPGITASLNLNGTVEIVSDINIAADKLRFREEYGTPLSVMGISPWQLVQRIVSPIIQDTERFGENLSISPDALTLVIGSTLSNNKITSTLDGGKTTFDAKTVRFVDVIYRSGAAHVYEYQPSATETTNDRGVFAFATLLTQNTVSSYDRYATGVAISNNYILVGAPNGRVLGNNKGVMHVYYNKNADKVWKTIRSGSVGYDSRLLSRAYIYNSTTSKLIADLPVYDLTHGMLPNSAESYIDYIINYDPAVYNKVPTTVSFNYDTKNNWGPEKVGTLWWDTNSIKYYDNTQGSTLDQFNNWGLAFPGSVVSVYEWIESNLLPKDYAAVHPGSLPLYTINDVYSSRAQIDQRTGQTVTKYYFWIRNSNRIPTDMNRPSAIELQNDIATPRSNSEPFAAIINSGAIAIYNCQTLIGVDTNLVIEYKNQLKPQLSHTEWTMFDDGTDLGVAPEFINKIRDSMVMQDSSGRIVPDPTLPIGQKYGTEIRPRQSVFNDPFTARKLYIKQVNSICAAYPINLVRKEAVTRLNNSEPLPDVTLYDVTVGNLTELGYLNKVSLAADTRALVLSDSSAFNGWSLYKLYVNPNNAYDRTWQLYRVQTYNVNNYWSYADWYSTKYNASLPSTYIIDTESQVTSLQLNVNDIIYIKNSNEGGWKIVLVNSDNLELLAQQNATIKFSDALFSQSTSGQGFESSSIESVGFSTDSSLEFAIIFDIVTNYLLTNEYRNEFKALIKLMIDTIATQHLQTDWLMKTSFIDLYNRVRGLDALPVYLPQPESIVTDFFKEVKPYHTKLKQYIAVYDNTNNPDIAYTGTTDFDLQPYYNTGLGKYRSPQLGNPLDTGQLSTQAIYQPWVNNHGYSIERIDVYEGGSGYTGSSYVIINGDGTGATAKPVIVNGKIFSIIITNPGVGYTYATVTVAGFGSGAVCSAIIGNGVVRNFNTTIKFDRYTYFNNIQDWAPNTHYTVDTVIVNNAEPFRVIIEHTSKDIFEYANFLPLVVKVWAPVTEFSQYDIIIYKNNSYIATDNFTSNATFDTTNLEPYNGIWLDNAADRIWAYYSPKSGMPGRDLAQLMVGIEYPGVGIYGPDFNQTPGYDVGNYDYLKYDPAITLDADGIADIYGVQSLDTKIYSLFTDTGLGLRPEDINIDGGKFVDSFESHAPEELIPGIINDTLNIMVHTLPLTNGNPDIKVFTASYNPNNTINFDPSVTGVSWPIGGIEKLIVVDRTVGPVTERKPTDSPINSQQTYTIDWENNLIVLDYQVNPSATFYVIMLGSDGLNSIYNGSYTATGTETDFDIPDATLNDVEQVYVKVNGFASTDWTLVNKLQNGRKILSVRFNTAPAAGDYVQIHLYSIPLGLRAYMEVTEQSFAISDTPSYPADYNFIIDNPAEYLEPISAYTIVRLNNADLIPPQQSYYIGDGITQSYPLTGTLIKDPTLITEAELLVLIDGKIQILGVDYTLTPGYIDTGSDPAVYYMPVVNFTEVPKYNSKIVFSDSSTADFKVYSQIDENGNYVNTSLWLSSNLELAPNSSLTVITMGNHDVTDLYTKMFSGSSVPVSIIDTGFESVPFESIGFDNEISSVLYNVYFTLPRAVYNINTLYVTLKDPLTSGGRALIPYQDYILETPTKIVLNDNLQVKGASIVTIRMFGNESRQTTNQFRIFKDIRDNTKYFAVKPSTTTRLVRDLNITDEWIYVENVKLLPSPDPKNNLAGVAMINGERITYGYVDTINNALGNLRRGTAGTGAAPLHQSGTVIIDSGYSSEIPNSADTIVTATTDTYITNNYNASILVKTGEKFKQGKIFTNVGESLGVSNTVQAQFIRES